jgi:CENP-Q, a CENPA-CAD centromere complex subunit
MHQIHLLRAEIDKEELMLQADETKLSDLMENAKAAEISRRLQAKQVCCGPRAMSYFLLTTC